MGAKETALADIDRVLAFIKRDTTEPDGYEHQATSAMACLYRWAPPQSAYTAAADSAKTTGVHGRLDEVRAALKTLRTDIDAGQLESFAQRVHADLLSDLMAQAEYLTGEGFRQAACVMAGGVLEQHIRLLATKYGLALTNPRGEAVKTSMLNDQLQSTANAYGKADQAQVSAWLKMRNDAAHGVAGFETTYNEGDLRRMCEGVRAFVIKYPA